MKGVVTISEMTSSTEKKMYGSFRRKSMTPEEIERRNDDKRRKYRI